jgi:hypothetical protein
VPGFCATAHLGAVRRHGYALTPARYVGTGAPADRDAAPGPGAPADTHEVTRRFARRVETQDAVRQALAALTVPAPERGWVPTRIGAVARVVGGGTPPTCDPDNFGGDVVWMTPKDLAAHAGRYVVRGARSLSAQGLARSSATLLPAGAVLVSSRAPIGLVAIAGRELATNQGIRSLVLDDSQVPEFWYYLLRSSTSLLDAHANGTTFREISGGSLADITVPVPDRERQQHIADLLGALDAEIENNLRVNEALTRLVSASVARILDPAT